MTMQLKTRKSNVEIITEFMEFCPTGAMGQMFIIDALTKYSNHVLQNERQALEEMAGGFIPGEVWVATARSLKRHLDDAYKTDERV